MLLGTPKFIYSSECNGSASSVNFPMFLIKVSVTCQITVTLTRCQVLLFIVRQRQDVF